MCIGFPTAPHGGLTVKANDNLWKASNDKATILKLGNINGPTPYSSSMFMFGTYSNTRGKKDAPPEDTQPQFSPSSLLGILVSDSILCWEARLHKSVAMPCSPSMDVLIHSKSTTSAPSAADPGVSPHASVSPLDEEKSILAAVQKSLSSAKAEAFHQGPNGGGTHLDFSAMLTGLDDDTPVCVLPRYLVVTGPSALPLGIWSCPTLGAGALVNALTQQLDSNTQAPFQVLTSSVLFSLFLQAAAEYPANMSLQGHPSLQSKRASSPAKVLWTALPTTSSTVLPNQPPIVCGDHFLYSFTSKMYTFYCNSETVAQGCFTNSLEKEYYHNIPASMNGSLLTLCPTANKHIIKCLTPATINAFTKNSPFADCLG
jgi:hypothetical protein